MIDFKRGMVGDLICNKDVCWIFLFCLGNWGQWWWTYRKQYRHSLHPPSQMVSRLAKKSNRQNKLERKKRICRNEKSYFPCGLLGLMGHWRGEVIMENLDDPFAIQITSSLSLALCKFFGSLHFNDFFLDFWILMF